MKIAICDDDKDARSSIISNITEACEFSEHILYKEYCTAVDLVNDISHGNRFDIIFFRCRNARKRRNSGRSRD